MPSRIYGLEYCAAKLQKVRPVLCSTQSCMAAAEPARQPGIPARHRGTSQRRKLGQARATEDERLPTVLPVPCTQQSRLVRGLRGFDICFCARAFTIYLAAHAGLRVPVPVSILAAFLPGKLRKTGSRCCAMRQAISSSISIACCACCI